MRNIGLLNFLMIGMLLFGQSVSLVHVTEHQHGPSHQDSHTLAFSIAPEHACEIPDLQESVETDCLLFHIVASTSGLVFDGVLLNDTLLEQARHRPVPDTENPHLLYSQPSIRAPPVLS